MSPSIYRMMERGAAGSRVPRGPGPSRPRLGDLGRAALTSADCARLLPARPAGTVSRVGFDARPGRQSFNPWSHRAPRK